MVAVELYRPDELSLYSTTKYPLTTTPVAVGGGDHSEHGFTHKADEGHSSEDEAVRQAVDVRLFPGLEPDLESGGNPYLREQRERTKSKGKGRKSLGLHLLTGSTPLERKNSTDINGEEGESISKMADLRVSNALTINHKLKSKKQLIKRLLLDDNDIIS